MNRKELNEYFEGIGDEITLLLDPEYLDEAIIGISQDNSVIYSYDKLVSAFIEHGGMDEEDAVEWIDYNTLRAIPYAHVNKPIIMYGLPDGSDDGNNDDRLSETESKPMV